MRDDGDSSVTGQQTGLFDICEPNHGGNELSVAAHESVTSNKKTMQLAILRCLREQPRTCEEVEIKLGMKHQTASARMSELKRDGRIRQVGKRATTSGRDAAVFEPMK